MSEPNLYDAMSAYFTISEVAAFNPSDHALFLVLIHRWNAARRPAVIRQWAERTMIETGLTKHTLPPARNRLIQFNVIFFQKTGNRGLPCYSFNALFDLPSPFPLLPHSGSICGSNSGVSAGVTAGVLTRERKRKEIIHPCEKDSPPPDYAEQAQRIVNSYPRREKIASALKIVHAQLEAGADFEAMLSGTRACAAIIRQKPSGSLNTYVPGAESFFLNERWKDDPETLRRQGDRQTGKAPMADDEVIRSLGGRAVNLETTSKP